MIVVNQFLLGSKPTTLYHGSFKQDLKMICPRKNSSIHPSDSSYVYATNDISYAVCFTVGNIKIKVESWGKGPWHLTLSKKDSSILNQPCSVYSVGPKSFESVDSSTPEFRSIKSVKVLKEIKYATVKECLKQHDIVLKIAG